ncbi:MAG: hypothetical protein E3J72_20040 [Planctomycetota bacterium]|nr:MAG: hypothetical protein E3J72_20040 [Planctomycetota bacterium]
MKHYHRGQDASKYPARFHFGSLTRAGRAQFVFIAILALALLVLVLALILRNDSDDGKKRGYLTGTQDMPSSTGKTSEPAKTESGLLAPKPDPEDPQYKKLKICLDRYRVALEAMGRIPPHDFKKVKSAQEELKNALEAFGGVGDNLVLLLLGEYESETDAGRRAELLALITRFCDERTARRLLGLYSRLSLSDRRALVMGLTGRNMPGLTDVFNSIILGEKDTAIKNYMMDYMLAWDTEQGSMKPRLFDWFDQTYDAAFRIHILKSMTRYGADTETRDFYESILAREKLSTRERMAAMYSFAKSHRDDAVPAISKYADSTDFKTKASAIMALEYAGGDAALQILDDLARNDPDERIRKRAADSAKRLRNPRPKPGYRAVKLDPSGRAFPLKTPDKKPKLPATADPK